MRKRLLTLMLLLAWRASAFPFTFKDPYAVTVTTSATALATGVGYTFVEVCNADASKTLYLGFSTAVTTSTGRPLPAGTCIQFTRLSQTQAFYGIGASGSLTAIVTKAFET